MSTCKLCPRNCKTDRETSLGFCRVPEAVYIAKTMLHKWEEPCICHGAGAGAIFFCGCNLHCIYCQNRRISEGEYGEVVTEDALSRKMLELQEAGASCIDLVTPTQYTAALVRVLTKIKHLIHIPIVWNSSGYEKTETLKMLEGIVNIYLPDFKYYSAELSRKYSGTADYFEIAREAVWEMLRQTGAPVYDGEKLRSGVIVRHLVLPGCRKDSIVLIDKLSELVGEPKNIILSLMSQYTPDFYMENCPDVEYKNLTRRLTSFEYSSVLSHARELGFEGYFQDISSAVKSYTPDF